MFKVTLADVMTQHVIRVSEDVKVKAVARILLEKRINGVVVVKKGREEEVLGVVTTTDLFRVIRRALVQTGNGESLEKESEQPVGSICNRNFIRLSQDTALIEVVIQMLEANKFTLPVYDGDRLVGIVGRHDILDAAFNA